MIKHTSQGLEAIREAMARGAAVLVVNPERPVPDAARRLMSDARVMVDVTPETTGIKGAVFPAAVERWIHGELWPAVRGAHDPDVLVVHSWEGGCGVAEDAEYVALKRIAAEVNEALDGAQTDRDALREIAKACERWSDRR
jgi:hypothetical protein